MSVSDLLRHSLTPYSRAVKAMGYPKEIAGIRGRYLRCREYWANHLEKAKATILRGAERAEQRRKAVILGSGLLHDVPLDELAAMFREVILVDLIHPFNSCWQTRHLPNVQRVSADVTNTLDEAYRVAWDAHLPLPRGEPRLFLDDPEVDFTASVNLLSQLPCMPVDYLKAQGAHASAKIDAYARDLIQAHLDYLGKLPGKVTLITDFERLRITLRGDIVERRDLFLGVPWPTRGEEWEWKLAPCPEADKLHHYYRRVLGIADWK